MNPRSGRLTACRWRMFFAYFLSLLVFVASGALASMPARPAGGPAAGLSEHTARSLQHELSAEFATAELRLEVQQRAWQIVADRHYDPALNGVDWQVVRQKYQAPVMAAKSDAEMYLVLKAMVRELKDSHTRVVTPRESADHRALCHARIGAHFVGDRRSARSSSTSTPILRQRAQACARVM